MTLEMACPQCGDVDKVTAHCQSRVCPWGVCPKCKIQWRTQR